MLMYPAADIRRCSPLSADNPAAHLALAGPWRLLEENVLVIGSSFSFHNLEAFSWRGQDVPDSDSDDFRVAHRTCAGSISTPNASGVVDWEAPSRLPPREEHLPRSSLPRDGGKPASVVFDDTSRQARGCFSLVRCACWAKEMAVPARRSHVKKVTGSPTARRSTHYAVQKFLIPSSRSVTWITRSSPS
jgi:hypothetical protein